MATEYGLYDMDAKAFIWLGKRRFSDERENEFQLPDKRICAFLATREPGAELRIFWDCGNLPDEGDDESAPIWKKLDGWNWPSDGIGPMPFE
jgi:hypothetical protein